MNPTQALNVISEALDKSNLKGVFNLRESATVYTALAVLSADVNRPQEELQSSVPPYSTKE